MSGVEARALKISPNNRLELLESAGVFAVPGRIRSNHKHGDEEAASGGTAYGNEPGLQPLRGIENGGGCRGH